MRGLLKMEIPIHPEDRETHHSARIVTDEGDGNSLRVVVEVTRTFVIEAVNSCSLMANRCECARRAIAVWIIAS